MTMMPSTDPNYQGLATLEMLYHEASHTIVFPHEGALAASLQRSGDTLAQTVPADLWHVLIFFTSADAAKKAYACVGVHYDSPNDRAGLWTDSGPWTTLHEAAALYWQAYIDGMLTMDQATTEIIRASHVRH